MRHAALLLAVGALVSALAVAQDRVQHDVDAVEPGSAERSFVVQLTEFRLASSEDPDLTADEIGQTFERMGREGALDLIGTVRVTALEGLDCHAQFGRTTAVTQGVTVSSHGAQTRSVRQVDLGITVRLSAWPHGERILLELSYEAARLVAAGDEDIAPDIRQMSCQTTLLLRPGRPAVVAGTSEDGGRYLAVTVEE